MCILISGIFSCSSKSEHKEADLRIISLGGVISEILAELDVLDNVVARDITSIYPETLLEIESLGHHSQVKIESILAVDPNMIITTKGFLPDELKSRLSKYPIEIVEFDQSFNLSSTTFMIDSLGKICNNEEKARLLISHLPKDPMQLSPSPKVIFIYARGAGALNVAGDNTFAASLIELAGAQQAVRGFDGFRTLTPEALAAANPDFLLFFSQGFAALGGEEGILSIPGVRETNAGKNRAFIHMDASLLNNFGPRLGIAVSELNQRLSSYEQ